MKKELKMTKDEFKKLSTKIGNIERDVKTIKQVVLQKALDKILPDEIESEDNKINLSDIETSLFRISEMLMQQQDLRELTSHVGDIALSQSIG